MSQQFCLKWNNHTTNMLQVFENLLSTEALVDVTLACEGLSLKAHKMVLSACSPFFQSLFLENPCKHPIVIMKDMRYSDLKAIIDFMYRGEVNVSHDQLSALLKTAETLKVKGLAEVTGENRHAAGIVQQEIIAPQVATPLTPTAQRTDTPPLVGKRKRGRPRKRSLSDSNRSDDEGVASKIKEQDSPEVEELSGDASMEAPSDMRTGGLPNSSNSQSQVPSHSSNNVNSFSKSHLSISQDPQVDDQASGDENEFEVEPSKLLEQTLTTDNVPSNSQNSTGHVNLPSVSGLEISRRSMSSTDSISQAVVPASDSLGSNLQGPDSPQDVPAIGRGAPCHETLPISVKEEPDMYLTEVDTRPVNMRGQNDLYLTEAELDIKPQILSFDDPPISPVAGTSHGSERSMMMYMDQSGVASIPGPSNYQDNSALVPHDSQPQGRKTLWWNQRMQKLQAAALRQIKFKSSRFPSGFRGSPKQAICPFCFKVFYDKSTMNRHVSKRVCLGLQFQTQTPTLIDDDVGLSVPPAIPSVQSDSPVLNSAGDPTEPLNSETEVQSEGSPSKSSRVPCPYCNKLLKGERGVRKHIDFYGCPMAVGAKPAELN